MNSSRFRRNSPPPRGSTCPKAAHSAPLRRIGGAFPAASGALLRAAGAYRPLTGHFRPLAGLRSIRARFSIMVGPGRFGLPASALSGLRSSQLSYGPESSRPGAAGTDRRTTLRACRSLTGASRHASRLGSSVSRLRTLASRWSRRTKERQNTTGQGIAPARGSSTCLVRNTLDIRTHHHSAGT